MSVFRFPDLIDESNFRDFTFIAGPLRLEVRAENHLKAMVIVNAKVGNIPIGVWMPDGVDSYRWVEGNFFD